MANKKGSRQLKWTDRIRLETMWNTGHKVTEIAAFLHVHRSTVYNELRRGEYEHLNSDYTTETRYSADLAQQRCEENLKVRGTQLKIGNDLKLANYMEEKIADEGYSPEAVLGELDIKGKWSEFDVKINSPATIYSYIDKGIFLRLTNKDLPVKKNEKRKYEKVHRQKRAEAGESIEQRPKEIEMRKEFGHWEMDSIIGKKGISKNTLLTLTERKTRNEIIFKLPDHTDESVVAALDRLERRWGSGMFQKIFKSITVDNGSEFADVNGMERSVFDDKKKRTKLYYCHPYSSWERGTNEVTNRMVRRKVPKGTDIDCISEKEIQKVEEWMNHYPRRIHGFHTAAECFEAELTKLA